MKLDKPYQEAITRYVPSFRQYLHGTDGQRYQQERVHKAVRAFVRQKLALP
jgi:hypothetical protein